MLSLMIKGLDQASLLQIAHGCIRGDKPRLGYIRGENLKRLTNKKQQIEDDRFISKGNRARRGVYV